MSNVKTFLKATGNDFPYDIGRDEFFKQIAKLLPLLQEEVAEVEDALLSKDLVNLVKELDDVRVYISQFNYLLDRAGIDRVGVSEAVDLNNSLKWTTDWDLGWSWFCEQEHNYALHAIKWLNEDGDEETTYCLKDNNGKVRKYGNFPKVDLKEFIPAHLLEVKNYEWGSHPCDFDQLLDETSDS